MDFQRDNTFWISSLHVFSISTFGPARDGLGCVIIAIDVVDSEPI